MMRTTYTVRVPRTIRTLNRVTLQLQKRNKTANINVKKTVVYTRVNGSLHIENCKNYKKVLLLSTLTIRRCAGG